MRLLVARTATSAAWMARRVSRTCRVFLVNGSCHGQASTGSCMQNRSMQLFTLPLLTTPLNPIRYTLPDFYFRSSYSHSPSANLRDSSGPQTLTSRSRRCAERASLRFVEPLFAIHRTSLCYSSNLSLRFVEPEHSSTMHALRASIHRNEANPPRVKAANKT